jgi:iron complex outermembrane receptor protein
MLMKILLLFVACAISITRLDAQEIRGIIKDDKGMPLNGASLEVRKSKDSAIVKLGVSNTLGEYEFINIPTGNYFITGTFINFSPTNSRTFEYKTGEKMTLPEIILSKASGTLAEVRVVTTARPLVEVSMEKTVLNVEGTINAVGQDALELLRKAPGVTLSQDDNISLNGKAGAVIYIDGRRTPLTASDLAAYLKSLQSTSIEAIEIISNPSAKYEAAGNAGIINIRLKKDKTLGTNGSVTAGYNQGIYPKYNAGFNVNHRNRLINIYANYNYRDVPGEWGIYADRTVGDTFFKESNLTFFTRRNHVYKAGLDYFINKKSTIGFMINGTVSKSEDEANGEFFINYTPAKNLVKVLLSENNTIGRRTNQNVNINYRYADASKRELNMDADYGLFRFRRNQLQPNIYYDPTLTTILESRVFSIITPTNIDIYTYKADYEQDFQKGRLGFGAKFSYIKTDNDFTQYTIQQSVQTLDTSRTNSFLYKENINAFYLNYNRVFKKFKLQLGLRLENTIITGNSNGFRLKNSSYTTYDSVFKRNYTNLFPNIAISFNTSENNQLSIVYGRRIDRPNYEDMNPFEYRLNEYAYRKGNTDLRPQYTNNITITNAYKKLTTTLTYSHIYDGFGAVVDTLDRSKNFITFKNLSKQNIVSLGMSYTLEHKWYTLFTNLNANYQRLQADLGKDRKINYEVYTWNYSQQHSIRFGKGWTGEVYGYYNSPGLWGIVKSISLFYMDAGIQKRLLDGKVNLKVSVSDVFKTMKYGGKTDFAGQVAIVRINQEFRQLKLALTYNLGSSQVKAARQRKTGLDDESKRAGSN